jgi:hypothetical protein
MARDSYIAYMTARSVYEYSTADYPEEREYASSIRSQSDIIDRRYINGFRRPTDYRAFRISCSPVAYYCYWGGYSRSSGEGHPYGDSQGVFGCLSGIYPDLSPRHTPLQRNFVVAKAVDKIASGDFNAGQALAELPETLRFLLGATTALAKALRDLKRGHALEAQRTIDAYLKISKRPGYLNSSQRNAAEGRYRSQSRNAAAERSKRDRDGQNVQSAETIANTWLGYKLGIVPILGDIHAIQEELKRDFPSDSPASIKVAIARKDFDNLSLVSSRGDVLGIKPSGSLKTSIECKLYYGVEDNILHAINQLGLTNPYALAWELVPLSFVVDWFIPVGVFLRSFTAFTGVKYLGGYVSVKNVADYECHYSVSDGRTVTGDNPSYKISGDSFRRYELPLAPVGYLGIVQPNFNWGKVATAAALITTLS